ncbi:MAG: insulinase family protein [Chloroflexi bacterium]|nr:insulinase family protein [Chloroflexota bacterium]
MPRAAAGGHSTASKRNAAAYQKDVLPNGLRVITSPMPEMRSVTIGLFLAVGSRFETPQESGVSHFIEHMLFKGTDKYPTSKDVSGTIEGIGGVLNAATDKELTVYWAKVAGSQFSLAFDVLVDMILAPKFDPEEIEKERKVIIEELGMYMDSPHDWVHVLIDEVMWPNHPLGWDVGGTKDSVTGISRDDLVGYMGRSYGPRNLVISVAGDVKHELVLAEARKRFAPWAARELPTFDPAPAGNGVAPIRVEYKATEQANLCIAGPALSRNHPDRFKLALLNVIFGEGMTSRLFMEIREKLGLAYDVHSYINHFADAGALVIYAGVDPSKMDKTIKAIVAEIDKLRQSPVSAEELHHAREYYKGRMVLRLEDTRAVAGWTGGQELLNDKIMEVDEVIDIIDRITPAELHKLAQDVFTDDWLHMAAVGPFKRESRFQKLLRFA